MKITNIETEIINAKDLKHFDRNPRTISKKDMDSLKKSIEKFGFVEPLVIDEDNVILGGNQRYDAAIELGMQDVPCWRIKGLSENEKFSLNVGLNKISGEWDEAELTKILSEIDENSDLLDFSGFSKEELNALTLQMSMDLQPYSEKEFDESIETNNKCPKCGYIW